MAMMFFIMFWSSPMNCLIWRDECTTLLLSLLIIDLVRSLKLTELHVPASVQMGARAHLACRWQLGTDVLYSVKWYKDGKEFFRFVPKEYEPIRMFYLPGLKVAEFDSCGANLTLAPANLQTAGRYRCEVSGEKPFFPSVTTHADMQIIVLPEHGPVMSGLLRRYKVGDKLLAHCMSGKSRPPTDLAWYINGERVYTNNGNNLKKCEDGLTATSSTLELEVQDAFFKGNRINVKCLATLHPIYWKSTEENVVKEWGLITKRSEFANIHTNIKSDQGKENNTANLSHLNSFLIILPGFYNYFYVHLYASSN